VRVLSRLRGSLPQRTLPALQLTAFAAGGPPGNPRFARDPLRRATRTPALLTPDPRRLRAEKRIRRRGGSQRTRERHAGDKGCVSHGEREQRRGLLSERPLDGGSSRSHEGPSEEDPALSKRGEHAGGSLLLVRSREARRIAEEARGGVRHGARACGWHGERKQRRGLLSERPLDGRTSRSHEGPSEEDHGAAYHLYPGQDPHVRHGTRTQDEPAPRSRQEKARAPQGSRECPGSRQNWPAGGPARA
jgi:hypothetical protein